MSRYQILSIDGGGIRGVLTAILLERLEEQNPDFLNKVDLIAGTSTGGLIALGLASGKSPSEARILYEKYGKKVFSDSLWDNINDLGGLIGASYSIKYLKEVLNAEFGELKLDQLNTQVLISSFDLDNSPEDLGVVRTWKPKFFHNFPGSDSDGQELVVDVALRTAVAPTYFPIYQGYIDGGVVANNPSMCALAQALHPPTGGQILDDIVLLSMGTGHSPQFINVQNGDWGLLHWAPYIISVMLEGGAGLADYQCRQLLDKSYLRVNPMLPIPIGMDKVDQIPLLVEIAEMFDINPASEWIREYYLS